MTNESQKAARERLLSMRQVRELVTLSKQKIYRRIKRSEFPRQVRIWYRASLGLSPKCKNGSPGPFPADKSGIYPNCCPRR